MPERCPNCGFVLGLEKYKLTYSQKMVYCYLYDRFGEWVSPTEIGNHTGERLRFVKGQVTRGLAWACSRLKKLLKLGLIKRNVKGQYRVYKKIGEALCE